MTVATKLKSLGEQLEELPDAKPDTLHRAMAHAFAEIEAATKSAANEAFKRNGKASKYADLPAVIEAVKPALVNHGLWVSQHCQPSEDGVIVETVLHHYSGESLNMGSLYVPANKRDPHGFGSALTYARRYAFQTAFVVPTEDDDGNAAVAALRPSARISMDEFNELRDLLEKTGVSNERFCKRYQITAVAELPVEKLADAKAALQAKLKEPANA
jgi:hypothetical protein